MPGIPKAQLRALEEIVGPSHVLVDPDLLASYTVDWTGRFRGHTTAVIRPGSTEEVAAIVAFCRLYEIGLTLQGGNTGLVGGGVPLAGEVVCSLTRLSWVGQVDPVSGQITVGAGATVGSVQAAAENAGWSYGVDFASRESATIGGSIATNAGGMHVIRNGDTRAQVLGVEAVLGTGAVVAHLGGLLKDNTGYNLASLLCGSEGTLGIVTAARLRLVPQSPHRMVALLAFDDSRSTMSAAVALRSSLRSLSAAEVFFEDGLELVRDVFGLPAPFPQPHSSFLLVEASDADDPTQELSAAIDLLTETSDVEVADVAVALDASRSAHLWRYREAHTEAINSLGAPHKLDVSVPLPALPDFVDQVASLVGSIVPAARTWLFGHAADGNIHVNVTGVDPNDDRVDDAVFRLVVNLGGSISAEHGIGTAKRRWLRLVRSDSEIDSFRRIKQALDPDSILNPNVLL